MVNVQRLTVAVLATVALLSIPALSHAQSDVPVASWSMNEGAGSTVGDTYGTLAGTVSGATWTTGRYGEALSFDGNDSVTIGDFDLANSFTITAWMQTQSLMPGGCAALVMKSMDYGIELCQGNLSAGVGSAGAWTAYLSHPLTPADLNVWKHVALTYDKTILRLYVDGGLIGSALGAHATNNNALMFGRSTSGQFWNGRIDEVRIDSRVLSQAEIQSALFTPLPNPLPPGPPMFQNDIILTNLSLPTNIEFLPDGTMLIGQLAGTILALRPGATAVEPAPFHTLTNIGTFLGQQGLMDIELDPDFATNNYYYLFYTLGSPNQDRVSRFTANGLATVPGSELVLWQDPVDAHAEHHGGDLSFGPDGKLFITLGEHFDPPLSQNLTTDRGKVIRINTDGTVPPDNPFNDGAGPNRETIWAMGLRNPFRAAFDPVTGRYIIGDVGGNVNATSVEELNRGAAGANYGWPMCDGPCGVGGMTNPVYSWAHGGRDAAGVAGFFYRGTQFPREYRGSFFYADYTQNWIRRLTFDNNGNVAGSQFFEPLNGTNDGPYGDIVHLTEGPDGSLYYTDLGYSDVGGVVGVGKIRRIRYTGTGNQPPTATASATPTSGPAPLTVNFSSAGSSDPEGQPLTYSWNFGDGATSTAENPSHTYASEGAFTAVLVVSDGEASRGADPLSIEVGDPPIPTILGPSDNSTFRAGDTINFSGTAVDADGTPLPPSAYSWSFDFHHNTHLHPTIPLTGVTSGTVAIPTLGHDYSGNTRYEIRLTVTDANGLTASTSVFIFPQKVNLTFNTQPAGLTIKVDGISHVTPFVYDTLVGFTHTIEAPDQSVGNSFYIFNAWSDGGLRAHQIVVPAADGTYTASFTSAPQQHPLTFAQSTGALSNSGGTSLSVQLTNVSAGSLIVAYVKWEGTAAGTLTVSDGTSAFTPDTINSASNGDLHGRFYYLLSSSASGTVTYTATWSAANSYRRLLLFQYTYAGTLHFDGSNRATATSGTLTTGNITTTGIDEVVFGAYGEYDSNNTTNERINDAVADEVIRAGFASMWSRTFNTPFTGGATASGNSPTWIGSIIAFKRDIVSGPNTPPTLSPMPNQTVDEDISTGALAFSVNDSESSPGTLTMSGSSSNQTLVPAANIVFGGLGANRTVTIMPGAHQSGTATITLAVSDGQASASTSFLLTVTALNDAPTISTLGGQATSPGVTLGPLAVTVGDVETPAANLTLTGGTTNPALVPTTNIVFGGSGANRTITITPVAGQTGSTTITMTVSDGLATTSSSFPLTVSSAPPLPLTFVQSQGAASNASGTTLTAQLTNVNAGSLIVAFVKWEGTAASTVTFADGTSTFTADSINSAANGNLHGRFYYLLASAASGTVTYTATWSAGRDYRRLLLYEYRYGGTVSLDGSNRATAASGNLNTGPITTTGTDEVVFGAYGEYDSNNTANEQINGVAADRVVRNSFASMWSKSFTGPFTGAATATGNSQTWVGNVIAFKHVYATGPNTPPTITALGNQTVSEDTATSALAFAVNDAETAPGSLTISGNSSNPTLVPPAGIVFGGSGFNRSVTVTPAANQSGTATIAVTVSDGQAAASSSFLLTVTALNDAPAISALGNQSTSPGVAVGPLAFTVSDVDTPVGSLTLNGASTNTGLVPVTNIVFGGSGSAMTVTVTPVAGQTGSATITVTVGDGVATASSSFLLTVSTTPPQPLTFQQSLGVSNDAGGTTLTAQLTNVAPGSLIVAYVKWEGTAASTVAVSDGSSTFTADAINSAANGDLHGRFYYLLSSTTSGTVTYTATWSAARPYRKLLLFRYTYGGFVSFDGSSRATAASGTLVSGNVTTTGGDEVVFGAYGEYGPNNTTSERINAVVADHVVRANFASMWSKTFSAPFTGDATASSNSAPWIGSVIAFKRTDQAP